MLKFHTTKLIKNIEYGSYNSDFLLFETFQIVLVSLLVKRENANLILFYSTETISFTKNEIFNGFMVFMVCKTRLRYHPNQNLLFIIGMQTVKKMLTLIKKCT